MNPLKHYFPLIELYASFIADDYSPENQRTK